MTEIADARPLDRIGSGSVAVSTPEPRMPWPAAGHEPDAIETVNEGTQRGPVRLSVVVPTRQEAETVPLLLELLGPAFAPLGAEIIFVDDSDDETPEVISRQAVGCPVPVRLIRRHPGTRRGGLGGAVVAAARHARGEWVLVMDADLQHPPEAAAALARRAIRHEVDVVIGTRRAGGGSAGGLAGSGRLATSSGATRLARAVFPRRLATVTDPMSGLFAFRRSAIDLELLDPLGFKILLEILVRHPRVRVAEVAYQFGPRQAGRSKASLREGGRFVRHLGRLRHQLLVRQLRRGPSGTTDRVRQLARMLAFGLVGLSGVAVNTFALWLLHSMAGMHHLAAAALATQASTLWNFVLVEAVVYRGRGQGRRRGRAVRFVAMNNLLLLARLPVLQALLSSGVDLLVANAATLMALFLVRFLVADRVIYGPTGDGPGRDPVRVLVDLAPTAAPAAPQRRRSRHLPYRYDVAGVVSIGSQIRLPELEFFRAQWVSDRQVDIAVRVGDVGSRRPRRRAEMTEQLNGGVPDRDGQPAPTLRYEEHLGRLGANFRVDLGDPITVEVGPLLARSPHVVYTNIIEALLRFVLIDRDRMLLHSACVSLDGVGVMLSALTDTGKTATVLRLLREHGGRFLSDDMTVVDAAGNAVCFPKPLTISAHTLRAVRADDLTSREWRRLQLQSRLHSKGGRSIALTLSRFNLPIMGINALTQILVPPPKYTVDRLVPCQFGSTTRVQELFIIERGAPALRDVDHASTVSRMLANTDDAYGFPPFRYLAPAIALHGQDYAALRRREEEILGGFLSGIRTRVLASDCYGWADEIPRLLAGSGPAAAGATGAAGGSAHRVPAVRPPADADDRWPQWDGAASVRGGVASTRGVAVPARGGAA
ncbi:MAG: glycosyltransferase [Actinobacteria bacterium]|nr:glycosyltransferase [Actinomycetota bacterium]